MKIPPDTIRLHEVFNAYNQSFLPLQLLFPFLAVTCAFIIMRKPLLSGKLIPLTLGLLWIAIGAVHDWLFFSRNDEDVNIFSLLFIIQGILFLRYGLINSQRFEFSKGARGITAFLLIMYSLFIYPAAGYHNGNPYPYLLSFGLPYPATVFTFGVLVLSKTKMPFYMIIIPGIWAAIGFYAALNMGIYENAGLIISAIAFGISNKMKHTKSYRKLLLETRNHING